MHFKKYLQSTFLILITISLAVISMNFIVDPFKMFSILELKGFNQSKPALFKNVRMSKAFNVRKIKPVNIILGTSRADVALDPEHDGWNSEVTETYNLALSSGRINELEQYLKHAHNQKDLRRVVLGLDLFMFDANMIYENGFSLERLSTVPESHGLTGLINDLVTSLFSIDALLASWQTIISQNKMSVSNYFENGMRDTSSKWQNIQAKGGHFAAVEKSLNDSINAKDGWESFSLSSDTIEQTLLPMSSFQRIVAFCVDNNIELFLYFSPTHAKNLEVIWVFGLWDDYEMWKKDIVRIVFDKQKNKDQIKIWDFSGFNSITMESVPVKGDIKSKMKWYWESSHFKVEVGSLILDRMFSLDTQNSTKFDNFGVLLNPENIGQHLKNIRSEHLLYAEQYPEDIKYIHELIISSKK